MSCRHKWVDRRFSGMYRDWAVCRRCNAIHPKYVAEYEARKVVESILRQALKLRGFHHSKWNRSLEYLLRRTDLED